MNDPNCPDCNAINPISGVDIGACEKHPFSGTKPTLSSNKRLRILLRRAQAYIYGGPPRNPDQDRESALSADIRAELDSNTPETPAVAFPALKEAYEEIARLNALVDTRLCSCPPNCQGPDTTDKICRAENTPKAAASPEPHPRGRCKCQFCGEGFVVWGDTNVHERSCSKNPANAANGAVGP